MNVAQASGGELTSEELGHAVARKITINSKYLKFDELVVGKKMVRRRHRVQFHLLEAPSSLSTLEQTLEETKCWIIDYLAHSR